MPCQLPCQASSLSTASCGTSRWTANGSTRCSLFEARLSLRPLVAENGGRQKALQRPLPPSQFAAPYAFPYVWIRIQRGQSAKRQGGKGLPRVPNQPGVHAGYDDDALGCELARPVAEADFEQHRVLQAWPRLTRAVPQAMLALVSSSDLPTQPHC